MSLLHTVPPALIVLAVACGSAFVSLARAQTEAPRKPASTLTRTTSPSKAPGPDGFIQGWLILEPIGVKAPLTDSGVQTVVKTDYFPEQLSALPRDGDKVTVAGTEITWHAVETVNYNVNLYHFAYALGKPTSNVLFWAVTVVNSPAEIAGVRLAIGSNAASVWWVNGKEVIGLYNDRQSVIDDGVSKRLTLQKGPNVIRAAIVNAGGATDFCARFLDEHGNPVRSISAGVEPASK